MVKDSDDVSYRECTKAGKLSKSWDNHYLAIATKNTDNDSKVMQINDVDIDSLVISTFRPDLMYTLER